MKRMRSRSAPVAPEQYILAVGFRSHDGRRWHAIGGGTNVSDAIDYARESCPHDTSWELVSCETLYGD